MKNVRGAPLKMTEVEGRLCSKLALIRATSSTVSPA